jgi:hypothetical protein
MDKTSELFFSQAISSLNLADPQCIAEAFETFRHCTQDISNFQQRDMSLKPQLSFIAEQALNLLDNSVVQRLGVNLAPFNTDDLEKGHITPNTQNANFTQLQHERSEALQDIYQQICDTDMNDQNFLMLSSCFELALGEAMQVLDHKGVKHILPLLTLDRVTEVGPWAILMYVF